VLIAICEDEQVFVDMMLRAVDNWAQRHPDADLQTRVYGSPAELWTAWETGLLFDMLFLDIQFQGMSGFTLAQKIRESDVNIPIVFVTNTDNYLQQGYEVSAFRYLKKPIRQMEIDLCLNHCQAHTATMLEDSFVIVKKGCALRMPFRDVLYVSTGIHSVVIHTRQGMEHVLPIKSSFETYAAAFPPELFVRCHRGYLVNLLYVQKYTKKEITLASGIVLPVGRLYADRTLEIIQQYMLGGIML